MPRLVKIKRALVSVSDKTGIVELCKTLQTYGVEIISTGGTRDVLAKNGINAIDISEKTGFPEIMDGRVKTLHPKVHGGLLAIRDNDNHVKQMLENNIEEIDLVVVNLYPFVQTVLSGKSNKEVVENIDIGGPSMLRSAAKNHNFVTVLADVSMYEKFIEEMKLYSGSTSYVFRLELARQVFEITANYDSHISSWFNKEQHVNFPNRISLTGNLKQVLRYGENPHQKAAVYVSDANCLSVLNTKQIQGKELSYNNINDADSALSLLSEFKDPACVIIKHANPCGVSLGENAFDAYNKAFNADSLSAFGGVIALNREVDDKLAKEMVKIFFEIIVAPSFTDEALAIFAEKKNVRVLITNNSQKKRQMEFKSVLGGFLMQEQDSATVYDLPDLKCVTKVQPTEKQMQAMLFAYSVCKHVKSNAIVISNECTTIGVGAGQMSRLESVRIAASRLDNMIDSMHDKESLVLASDAFFPFSDGLERAIKSGIKAVIQPGGSVRDEEVIALADQHGIAMIFTGVRHFKH